METTPTSSCPFSRPDEPARSDATVTRNPTPSETPPSAVSAESLPSDNWPPGPGSGLTGWGLLRQMSLDMPATLERWTRAHGDVVHLRIWPEHEIIVTEPTLIRQLLVEHHDDLVRWRRAARIFEDALGQSVLVVEDEAWRAKRRALQPAFAPQPVQTFMPTVAEAAGSALAAWPARAERWPIETALTELTMDVILRMMFSSPLGEDGPAASEAVRHITEAMNAEFFWPASLPDWVPWKRRKRRGIATLEGLIGRHVAQRLAMPRERWPDDLLTRLLALHVDDPANWPLTAIHHECRTAFVAGHETTAAALTWWAWCMATHPQAQARAAEECREQLGERAPAASDLRGLRWLGLTLQESMRLYPSTPLLLTRRALRPITLGGWRFPARTLFLLPLYLVQRDPRWFDEPLAFRPERFERDDKAKPAPRGTWLPFGAGPRVCLGQHLATAEMTVVAAMLLQRFRLARPAGLPTPTPQLRITARPAMPLVLDIEPQSAIRQPDH